MLKGSQTQNSNFCFAQRSPGIFSVRNTLSTRGAYLLYIDLKRSQTLRVGSLGKALFPAGRYVYVGSARRGIAARVLRHKRLALQKEGKLHWHIDYLLINRHTELAGEEALENGIECRISKRIAAMSGVTVPVPGFGSSDCRAGCEAHLYLLPSEISACLKFLFAKLSSRKGNGKSKSCDSEL